MGCQIINKYSNNKHKYSFEISDGDPSSVSLACSLYIVTFEVDHQKPFQMLTTLHKKFYGVAIIKVSKIGKV